VTASLPPANIDRPTAAAQGCAEAQLLYSRRSVLGITAGLFSSALMPRLSEASTSGVDPRLLVVLLRGGIDGLSVAAPVHDQTYHDVRGNLALDASVAKPLDSMFSLHPNMPKFLSMYRAGNASIVHATCIPVQVRSHFDGQDNLENGMPGISPFAGGWLNRLLRILPATDPIRIRGAIQIGTAPKILQPGIGGVQPPGTAKVLGWNPTMLPHLDPATTAVVQDLYDTLDPGLSAALRSGLATQALAEAGGRIQPDATGLLAGFNGAGRLLANPGGPRIAVLSVYGWDSHINEGVLNGDFGTNLAELDTALALFRTSVGSLWANTVVLMVTEFGRTIHVNGDFGTDHGVGSVALLAGGAVAGGKVIADWPGLTKLLDGRDLQPTIDLRSVFKGALRDHLGVPSTLLESTVFPGSLSAAPPLKGLIKG
jgi:uncharacterized protein (DUF1501 family)